MNAPGTAVAIAQDDVYGTLVSLLDFNRAVDEVVRWVAQGRAAYAANANVYSGMLGVELEGHRHHLNSADLVLPDGMPIVWLLRHRGHQLQRVHGDDLMRACCLRLPHARHFLLGGRTGQPELAQRRLARSAPELNIVGVRATPHLPLSEGAALAACEAIRRSAADIVWVGLGTPEQDRFMHDYHQLAAVPMVGVGSAFDVLSGHRRAAPAWIKNNGLQWAFRWFQEPRRLAPRYARYNPRFAARVARELLTGRRF